ncbi:YoaK family protein [Chitinophaga sancti]|uniref:YoaK family protein n=1 Tax=Chitinophaga sancti TaxID=1004 RepID=UPI002A74D5D8|nr:YoaK family protein [Chitinophaga sancti]WPQ64773.1 YoaK family protein [Chitinophaga sancti]
MEEPKHSIHWVTFMLSWVAGFCDTVTFVSGGSIFSAHVTGNFITFAAQMVSGKQSGDWVKLITFPTFVAAVMIGGWLARVLVRKYRIMLVESVLLILTGVLAMFLPLMSSFMLYLLVFMVVVAMGLQNAFGKLFAKETHGPTTMMTGNVTQAALDLGNLVLTGFKEPAALQSLRNVSILIGGFLLGCLMGAVMARYLGLTSIIGPGVAICICYLMREALPRKQLV